MILYFSKTSDKSESVFDFTDPGHWVLCIQNIFIAFYTGYKKNLAVLKSKKTKTVTTPDNQKDIVNKRILNLC